jgi:hypothetical protein
MAMKCLGVREDTGGRCSRPASSGSNFCYMHKPQEGDARIAYLEHDIYHCPDRICISMDAHKPNHDGQQLLFVPDLGHYRCDMCGGVLASAKDIDSEVLESILELPEVVEEGLRVECPTCSTNNDLSDGETALTNFAVEWYFWVKSVIRDLPDIYQCGVSNVGHCTVCGSTWFPGPGEFDALGRALRKNTTRVWRKQFKRLGKKETLWGISGGGRSAIKTKNTFGVQEQSLLRQLRLVGVETETEKRWKEAASRSDNLCKHVADNGKMCDHRKSAKSTHDQDYCYKHQPE